MQGKTLKFIRTALVLTQRELAEKLNVTLTINEDGEQVITYKVRYSNGLIVKCIEIGTTSKAAIEAFSIVFTI